MSNNPGAKLYDSISQIYFTATGTTRTIVETITAQLSGKNEAINLASPAPLQEKHFGPKDLVVAGMPVYSGRIPALAAERLANIKGSGSTPAIAVVAYGNREYEDALLELKDILEKNGFVVIGAGAFIAQHAIFPEIAKARPDEADRERIADFARNCLYRLESFASGQRYELKVKGNFPYREVKPGALKPTADDKCVECGACSEICPVGAIPSKAPKTKNFDLCIACAACVSVCPQGAQAFRGPQYEAATKMFQEKFSARKEPEVFI